ncbi:TetR/AcrR family transcriptional regulator [Rhodobacter sp. 24-YEA-8]|uniref:TetR/AcrR family transcriptional regulator n=1 Tax=Rhodobacter sp. 24-YEA-8 TaxID=1884310 RepID=UPI00089AFB7E|nr:TetR/AcrR family transcriptional regulator [Rhodobacter sp. 24-YEA-8]SED16547.1 transcriptional regulator, TetR family [Rhodobacter sp. 24-YEA-8]
MTLRVTDTLDTSEICRRMLERNPDTIRVQKERMALPKLMRIVEATLLLSRRQGFHATSLRELAAEASMSMGGLYAYFDSKNSLLRMMITEVASTIVEALNHPPEDLSEDPVAYLHWLIRTHIEVTDKMHAWFTFSYMEARFFAEAERNLAMDGELATEKIFAAALENGVQRGVFAIDDVGLTAALLKPLLQDWYVKHGKYRRRNVSPAQYAEAVITLFDRAIVKGTAL